MSDKDKYRTIVYQEEKRMARQEFLDDLSDMYKRKYRQTPNFVLLTTDYRVIEMLSKISVKHEPTQY
jgi:hypothetical protein